MPGLLATKLYRPSVPAKWVRRPHLIQRLNQGLELNRLTTLVSAPAGFGKTTSISDWLSSLESRPVAWLSLDPPDDDPERFFAYLIAAIQKVDATLGQEIEGVIRSGHLPPGEIISTTLINDILTLGSRFLLILDDFHVIQDPFILQVFEQLLANFPSPLHLVLITREDPPLPLARLRANNQLTEIRARDLGFTRRDIDRFLNEIMGLSLSQADIATLDEKTEGWIVGLQLAGLSIRGREDQSGFITAPSGSHRFILSYLTEQVLNQQPEEIQHFLLATSILDKLNGDLCNAVSGRSDSRGLLHELFNANLFLIPLDDEGQWYRYHHLFADLLRDLQSASQKDKTTELHQRASRWYVQAGMVNEAIQHALAAEDFAMAVDLLESHAMEMLTQGYAKTVNGWVQALPDKWDSQSPRTHLAFAWVLILRGAYQQASEYLEQLRATLIDSPVVEVDSSIRAEWLVMQSLNLYMQGKTTECMAMATQALELAPEKDNRVRSLAHYVQASIYQLMEDYSRAVERYQMSIQLSRVAHNLFAEMMSTTSLAGMALEHCHMQLAFEIASQAIERKEKSGALYPISAVVYASLGDVYFQRYQLEAARRNFQRALHLSILGGSNTITILCRVLLARLAQVEGDLATAAREIQTAVDLLPLKAPEYVRQEVVSQQVRIYLALDRPAAAEMALQRGGFSSGDQFAFLDLPDGRTAPGSFQGSISPSMGRLDNSILRLFLYRARNDPTRLKPGIDSAGRLIARAFKSQQLMVALETLLLRAEMYTKMGDHPACTADYVKALELAEPEGLIGAFIEQGAPVAATLADLARQDQLGAVPLAYVFSRRRHRAGSFLYPGLGLCHAPE